MELLKYKFLNISQYLVLFFIKILLKNTLKQIILLLITSGGVYLRVASISPE
jgi:hypothetical protein